MKLSKKLPEWLFIAVSGSSTLMALALLATFIVSAFTAGEPEPFTAYFKPQTLATMREWCAIALKIYIPVVLLPTLAVAPFLLVRDAIYIGKKDIFFFCAAGVAGAYGIYLLRDMVLAELPPDGRPFFARLALWPHSFAFSFSEAVERIRFDIAGKTGADPEVVPWYMFGGGVAAIFAGIAKTKVSACAKRFSWTMFLSGVILSLATSAFAFGFFSDIAGAKKQIPYPAFNLGDVWGEVIPQIFFALLVFACVIFFTGMVCESVSGARSTIGKVFALVFGTATAAIGTLWSVLAFFLGVFSVWIALVVIGGMIALVAGFFLVRILWGGFQASGGIGAESGGGWSSAPSFFPPSSSSEPEIKTTFTDNNGTDYVGKGKDPDTIEKQTPGDYAVFDRQFDGSYKERFGDRTLENP